MPSSPTIEPRRAPVVPRARRLPDGEVLPLERIVLQHLRHDERGILRLDGPPGSGKTTALAHLAAVLPREAPVRLFDRSPSAWPVLTNRLAVVVSPSASRGCLARLVMAPWGEDDWIEYLLATWRDQCASVIARVRDAPDSARLGGLPLLWRIVLDGFAADESLHFVASAVRRYVLGVLENQCCATAAQIWCLKHACGERTCFELPESIMPLLSNRAVQMLLGAERLADLLSLGRVRDELQHIPPDLIRETALIVRARAAAQARLEQFVRAGTDSVPAAASILAAADPHWTPRVMQVNLRRAVLDGVKWAGVQLVGASLVDASLTSADLCGADLRGASAQAARFCNAKLCRANLQHVEANAADFDGADLDSARLDEGNFQSATFTRANLERALLRRADLTAAKLSGACLSQADLSKATLVAATLDGTVLTRANLTAARFEHVRLSDAKLDGACLREASLVRADLESLEAADVDFAAANLSHSMLTASVLPRADFRGANLKKTRLAEVEWEGVDLRKADLRGATFHLGSCRSGLVGSTIPCEGSKTGFYTDELDERDYKPPEDIRKANLCGADLRGAKLKGVDFYLVDLRGARYTPRQAKYFRKCGAILGPIPV